MNKTGLKKLIRPLVRELHAYVPGEQPKIKGLIKLNTNENPYPPSSRVLRAIKNAVDGRLRLYPNPMAERLREKLARLHRCKPENIIVGNGSDELLALAVRALVEPKRKAESGKRKNTRTIVQYFTPSYSLYPVLADIHGAAKKAVPLKPDFSLPSIAELKKGSGKPPEGGTPNRTRAIRHSTFAPVFRIFFCNEVHDGLRARRALARRVQNHR
jgi:histidinol-phosphate aminotransferase